MIIPGKTAITRGIIAGLRDARMQAQPCGVDLSLKHVSNWTSPGTIDFSNQFRANSKTKKMTFTGHPKPSAGHPKQIHLEHGNYLVEFNETVNMPLNIMGQGFVRSSLWRSGALLSAGVMDCGYQGAVGAVLQVLNLHGITLYEDARLAQMVFHEMSEKVEGYSGVYQGSRGL
jgi:dUTP pyrophosphatase